MSAQTHLKRITAPQITERKNGKPIVCLTAYDAPTANILDQFCDILLVGDSVGMVVHGLSTTVGVTLDMMILHGQAVMRGSQKALMVVDLPFGSYEDSVETAFLSLLRASDRGHTCPSQGSKPTWIQLRNSARSVQVLLFRQACC